MAVRNRLQGADHTYCRIRVDVDNWFYYQWILSGETGTPDNRVIEATSQVIQHSIYLYEWYPPSSEIQIKTFGDFPEHRIFMFGVGKHYEILKVNENNMPSEFLVPEHLYPDYLLDMFTPEGESLYAKDIATLYKDNVPEEENKPTPKIKKTKTTKKPQTPKTNKLPSIPKVKAPPKTVTRQLHQCSELNCGKQFKSAEHLHTHSISHRPRLMCS